MSILSIKRRRAKGHPTGPVFAYVHARLSRLWRDATQKMITEIANNIMVDTGMAKSSTLSLAAKVRVRNAIAGTIGGNGPRRGLTNLNGSYDSKAFKSKAAGIRSGERGFAISFGTQSRPVFIVEFRITVYQHQFHEVRWESLQKGADAFLKFIEENQFKEPYLVPSNLTKWLITGTI